MTTVTNLSVFWKVLLRQAVETHKQLSNSLEPLTLLERPPQSRIAVLCPHSVSLCRAGGPPPPQWGYPTTRKQTPVFINLGFKCQYLGKHTKKQYLE